MAAHPPPIKLSPSDLAFEGFRLLRDKPKAVAVWTAFYFVAGLVFLVLLLAAGLRDAMMIAEQRDADAGAALAAMAKGGPAYLLILIFGLFVQAVMLSAVFRAVLRPQDSRFGYIRFGKDELRQMLLFLLLVLVLMVALFVIVLVFGIAAGIIHGVLGTMGAPGAALGVLAGIVIGLAAMGVALFVVVRLSLAPPLTFASGRVQIAAAWRISDHHFWQLFWAYVLACVLYIVLWAVAMIAMAVVAGLLGLALGYGIGDILRLAEPQSEALTAYLSAPVLIYALFSAALTTVQYVVLLAPTAVAYRLTAAEHPEIPQAQPRD